jgi:serine/threonine-protein kinase RsbW/sigma-B regulation protein RsbU (phosphoserine phosphatase)
VQTSPEAAPGARPVNAVAELRIRNQLDELARASAWLAQFAEGLALPTETLFRLDLGLTEALNNVVAYAYADAAEHEIRIRIAAEGDAVRLEVEDDGRAFDPLQAERPPPPGNLEEAPIGGLGIHLIRSMLDECHYRREAGWNRLTLIARSREADALGP